jgi:hypothetical protein
MAVTAHEQTDFEDWPAEAVGDSVRAAIGQLLVAIIESTAEGSRERQAAPPGSADEPPALRPSRWASGRRSTDVKGQANGHHQAAD